MIFLRTKSKEIGLQSKLSDFGWVLLTRVIPKAEKTVCMYFLGVGSGSRESPREVQLEMRMWQPSRLNNRDRSRGKIKQFSFFEKLHRKRKS